MYKQSNDQPVWRCMHMLAYRRIKKSEINYAVQLAQDEINIEPKRLGQYKTYLIFNDGERIGYVSFGSKADKTIYIYILAFEEHAQRQGFAAVVFDSIMNYGRKRDDDFKGLSATIHKVNEPAINAAKKHGFLITRERVKYLDFMKPVSS
jgi:RimJ/RimL family protein N-acetyltransferase